MTAMPPATKPSDGIAWITGASTGLGRALAIELVNRGWKVAVSARSEDKLKTIAEEVKSGKGENVIPAPLDVTDKEQSAKVVAKLVKDHGPIARAVMNAGTYDPMANDLFNAEGYARLMNINCNGVAYSLEPVLEHMAENKKGQVAITASVAGYRGLPNSIAYSSSKAALIAMAEALKFNCDPHNIRVQICNPGFVRTPLTDKNEFEMPFLMEVDDAARDFADGLDKNRFEIAFPWIFTSMVRRISRLPYGLYFPAVKKATAGD
ncbi:MAG: SDR family NAD(P)-dependent oxidoreductase [Pseudomonadota bacterium]